MFNRSIIHLLSFFLFLACSSKSVMASNFFKDDAPKAGSQAYQSDSYTSQSYEGRDSESYRICLLEAHKDRQALSKKVLTALKVTDDCISGIKLKIEKKKTKGLPDIFIKGVDEIRLVEPYELFDEKELYNLATQFGEESLIPLTSAIKRLDASYKNWDCIVGSIENLKLAINQTLWDQNEWNDLFLKPHRVTGPKLYNWFTSFHKTLSSLEIISSNLTDTWQKVCSSSNEPPYSLLLMINDLIEYFSVKKAQLWKLIKFFLKTLPDYEALTDDFFLEQNNSAWIYYFSAAVDQWPTEKNWQEEDLLKIMHLTKKFTSSISKARDSLSQKELEEIKDFWGTHGKTLWSLLRKCMNYLPDYDQLLDGLYPQEKAQEENKGLWGTKLLEEEYLIDSTYFLRESSNRILNFGYLLSFLKIVNVWDQPINIPQDLSKELFTTFSFSQKWQEKTIHFKEIIKPFTNIRPIIKLLPAIKENYELFKKNYRRDFGIGYDCFAPVAYGMARDGKRIILPQSSLRIFKSLDSDKENIPILIQGLYCNTDPVNVGALSALYLLEKLFGLPSAPLDLLFLENILVHKLSRNGNIIPIFETQPEARSSHSSDNRAIRLQEFLKNPKDWEVSSQAGFVFAQEQLTIQFLADFLQGMARGKQASFEQIDADSVYRQALFCILTQFFVPLGNWGLVDTNGKFELMRVRSVNGQHQGQYFLHSQPGQETFEENILSKLPFAHQEISEKVRKEFLRQDVWLILSHWITELKKVEGYFDDPLEQKGCFSVSQSDALNQGLKAWGLKIRISRGRIENLAHNFKMMQELLREPITYASLFNKLHFESCERIRTRNVLKKPRPNQHVKLFFRNVVLPTISKLEGTPFSPIALKEEAEKCLKHSKNFPKLTIEDVLKQIESKVIYSLFMGLYLETKDRDFSEAQQILNDCKISRQPFCSQDTLVTLPDMIADLISLADISNKPIDRQIEILSLLLELDPRPKAPHISWQELCQEIALSNDLLFIRKFLGISGRLREFLGRSIALLPSIQKSVSIPLFQEFWQECSGFPILEKCTLLKEKIALYEFEHYPSRLKIKEAATQEEMASDLFHQLLHGSLEGQSFFVGALADQLLLPRYAGKYELPKDLHEKSGYLASTGFASNPLTFQPMGRKKLGLTGPIHLHHDDGQCYILSWSERCIDFFYSSQTIPGTICETVISHDVSLLCLEWLYQLKKRGINITFFPWFMETLIEKLTQMQQLIIRHPLLTPQAVMQDLWPIIFYAHKQKQATWLNGKELSSHIHDVVMHAQDGITINDSDIDLDWVPEGKNQDLQSILEEMDTTHYRYLSKPLLSLNDAASEVLAYFIPRSYGSTVTEKVLKYIKKMEIDGRSLSLNQPMIVSLIKELVLKNASRKAIQGAVSLYLVDSEKKQPELFNFLIEIAPEENIKAAIEWYLGETGNHGILELINKASSFEAQKVVIALYSGCKVGGIDVQKDTLKISGTKSSFKDLHAVYSRFPLILTLDISDNGLDALWDPVDNSDQKYSDPLKYLTTLILSNNPLYDPTPLRDCSRIPNIVFSNTYVPGGNFSKHLILYSSFSHLTHFQMDPLLRIMTKKSKETHAIEEKNQIKAVINSENCLSSEKIKTIISFYKEHLLKIREIQPSEWGYHKDVMLESDEQDFHAYYHGIIVNIINQMAQNFWNETLADELFAPPEITQQNDSTLFYTLQKALTDPLVKPLEISQKWLFALKHHLPFGLSSADLIWTQDQKESEKGTYSLAQLNLTPNTLQNYLNCLIQHWEFSLNNNNARKWHEQLFQLAADQLAKNFSKEVLGYKWQNMTTKNNLSDALISSNASLEVKKLASALKFNLPFGTIPGKLSFVKEPVTSPDCLECLVISGVPVPENFLKSLNQFRNLKRLTLCKVQLPTLENILQLTCLEYLDLTNNQITSLESLHTNIKDKRFPNVRILVLKNNQLTSKPEAQLGFLQELNLIGINLSDNHLQELPKLGNIPTLKRLDVTNNFIPSELLKGYQNTTDRKYTPQRERK